MNLFRIPGNTRVLDCSRPRYISGSPDKPSVLLIHGFTGSPHDMPYLFDRLAEEGFSVSLPRLSGHGTQGADFLQSGWRDWYRDAVNAYLELASEGKPVYLLGLSMGGLLVSLLASQFPCEKLVLAAPAYAFTPGSGAAKLWITPLLAPFAASLPADPGDTGQFPEGDRRFLEEDYKSRNWIRQGSELWKLRSRAIHRLKLIRTATLLILSRNDETVSPRAESVIRRRLPATTPLEVTMLTESGHVVVDDCEKETVADRIISFFTRP